MKNIRSGKHNKEIIESQNREKFQQLLIKIATELVNIPLSKVDSTINKMLGEIGVFGGFDRVSVYKNDFECCITVNTHEWCAEGILKEIGNLQEVPFDLLSDMFEAHQKSEIFTVQKVDNLPEGSFKEYLKNRKICSLLMLPLISEGVNIGFVGFDAMREEKVFDCDSVSLLKVFAELIVNIETRRKADQALSESEEKHRRLFESMNQGVIYQAADGRIISVNPATERILGQAFEQLQNKTSMDPRWQMIREDGTEVVGTEHPAMIALQTGQTVGPVVRGIFHPDKDAHVWLSITAVPLFNHGEEKPSQVYATVEDITERIEAVRELRRLEWMLKPNRIAEITGKRGLTEQNYGDLTELNRARLILDSSGRDVLMDTANDYLYLMETSTAIYEANGDYALGFFSSGWCKALDDASRKLCETDDNRAALESGKWLCHESCWNDASRVSIERGKPVDVECNGGLRLYTVPIWADNQVVGSINFGYGSPPQEKKELEEIADKYELDIDELAKLAAEYQTRPPFIIELAKDRLHSSARLIGALVERRYREIEVHKLNEELEQRVFDRTAQLEAANYELEAFAYSVSHDLRAPLRAMGSFSELLQGQYSELLDEKGKHYLKRIHLATKRMGDLIDDLLQLSRVTRSDLHFQQVDISRLAQQIMADLQAAKPDRRVEVQIEENMPAIGDLQLLRLAMENLLRNAWKFTVHEEKACIEAGTIREDNKLVYYIHDNGVGFDMTYVDKLFMPFQRLHGTDEFPGTGIGLATVQRIISRHGGNVWAESEVGVGTTFYFSLGRSAK